MTKGSLVSLNVKNIWLFSINILISIISSIWQFIQQFLLKEQFCRARQKNLQLVRVTHFYRFVRICFNSFHCSTQPHEMLSCHFKFQNFQILIIEIVYHFAFLNGIAGYSRVQTDFKHLESPSLYVDLWIWCKMRPGNSNSNKNSFQTRPVYILLTKIKKIKIMLLTGLWKFAKISKKNRVKNPWISMQSEMMKMWIKSNAKL